MPAEHVGQVKENYQWKVVFDTDKNQLFYGSINSTHNVFV